MTTTFIIRDEDDVQVELKPGVEFYLIEIEHIHRPTPCFRRFQTRPARTNLSGEERVSGWLGTTNDISKEARGHWRVEWVSGRQINATRLDG